ncbi:MAG: flavohemoprotein [Myxococcales bacterium FL481]|nr:MAG: flavohemoprotein [Myxococcales bacterium FL481]
MALNAQLLRHSFQLATSRNPKLVPRFYALLFERYPQVQSLFDARRADEQHRRLGTALVAVLDHIEDAEWLKRELGAMGRRHDGYGVREEMYPWVGECLVAAMREAGGEDWTPEMTNAWTEAYGAIVSLMLAR